MDRRVKYTKKVIKDTFLSLLEEKELSTITVTEICRLADINRGTFYRYYMDVDDLLKNIEQEFIDEIKESPSIEAMEEHSIYSFTKGILEIFYNNKKLVRLLFNNYRNIYFLNEVLEICYSKCIVDWNDDTIDSTQLENDVVFIFNGALGVINYWIKNDFNIPINDLAKYIEDCTVNGARKVIPRRNIKKDD